MPAMPHDTQPSIEMTKLLTNEEINEAIRSVADNDTIREPPTLEGSGHQIPYIGAYWRDVDFDAPFALGCQGNYVGFLENNKWDYPEWMVTEPQREKVRFCVEKIAVAVRRGDDVEDIHAWCCFLAGLLAACAPKDRNVYVEATKVRARNEAQVAKVNAMWRSGTSRGPGG